MLTILVKITVKNNPNTISKEYSRILYCPAILLAILGLNLILKARALKKI